MLPTGFLAEIAQYPQLAPLAQSLLTDPDVSVRVNRAKCPDFVPAADPVPWCADGFYLPGRPAFTFDPAMHQGLYYVQDASSMAVGAVAAFLAGDSPVRYLDACAAPGGKTTAVLGALPGGSAVVANEYDFRRAEVLAENIAKWGNPNVVVSRGDTARLGRLAGVFDIVGVDAPCSGEGMMRKEAHAAEQWSPALVRQCAETQRQIIENVWAALRPGGYLVYSTCTFNRTEDEEVLSWMVREMGAAPVAIAPLDTAPGVIKGIDTPYPCYRFLPGNVRGEGLFIAVVRKPGNAPAADLKAPADKAGAKFPDAARWFADDMVFSLSADSLFAVPKANAALLHAVASKLDVLSVGVLAATVKGRDLVPAHEFALCTSLDPGVFPAADIDYRQALAYLQREAVTLPDGTPRGFVLLRYGGHPLGFVKNLGNRSNNLLPKPWRILSKSIPDTPPQIL